VLKLATFPAADNPAALIVELGLRSIVEWWASPAVLEEYGYVLTDEPELLSEVFDAVELCYPLTELNVIRHEPDNRFLECALAVRADYIVTVNTAPGHFGKERFGPTRIVTPGTFVSLQRVQTLVRRLFSNPGQDS